MSLSCEPAPVTVMLALAGVVYAPRRETLPPDWMSMEWLATQLKVPPVWLRKPPVRVMLPLRLRVPVSRYTLPVWLMVVRPVPVESVPPSMFTVAMLLPVAPIVRVEPAVIERTPPVSTLMVPTALVTLDAREMDPLERVALV